MGKRRIVQLRARGSCSRIIGSGVFFFVVGFSASADEFTKKILPVLESYCFDCHDGDAGNPKGDFDLFPFVTTADARSNPKAFLHVHNALHYREMPPGKKKQPTTDELKLVIDWIDREVLQQIKFNGVQDPGPPVMRRMTRLEYNNTVRDLLGLDRDLFSFPERLMARRDYFDPSKETLPDQLDISIPEYGAKVPTLLKMASLPGDSGAEHGFSNEGAGLNITPMLMERYLSVANAIVSHEDFGPAATKISALTGVKPRPPSVTRNQATGKGVYLAKSAREFAPVDNIKSDAPKSSDQAWLFRDHIAAAFDEGAGGVFQHPDQVGARVPGKGGIIRASFGRRDEKAILINPTETLWFVDFGTAHETSPPANIANSNKQQKQFRLNLKLDGLRENEGITSIGVVVLSRAKMSAGPVTLTAHFTSGKTAALTDEIATGAGEDNTFFSWQAPPGEFITDISVDGSQFSGDYVLLDDLGFITGKNPAGEEKTPPARKSEKSPAVAITEGDSEAEIRKNFAEFLSRAFRKAVSEDETGTWFAVYESRRADGQSRQQAMAETMRAVLTSPRFLFISANESPKTDQPVRKLTGEELACRLSYFLWSSMPDDKLFAAARSGQLDQNKNIEAEVRRMLADPKAKELSDSFAYQWLQLNNLLGAQPDRRRHSTFYKGEKVTMAAPLLQEALLLFETVLIENRPVSDLIDPDFTWLNPALIEFYGLEKEYATQLASAETLDKNGKMRRDNDQWFRCQLPDRKRGGILCLGSTLTLTSLPLRTSPVYRGAWVSEAVFNRPPPPPPAMVDELGEDDREMQEAGLTLRKKLEAHREKSACAGCHSRIDPLGFPLENFDAVGLWRDSYGKFPVDAGGILSREHEYTDIVSFKDAINKQMPDVHRGFIRHLMTYALGRKLQPYDEIEIQKIIDQTESKGLRDIIVEICTSYTFTHTRNLKAE